MASEIPSPPNRSGGERRQLTIMFCDLVGSTTLAERLDPEELHEVVRAYQAACAEVIRVLEGHIAQYLGDGLLVYFGYPSAHEDDAERAVRASLRITQEIAKLNVRLQSRGVTLAVRIGVHTGLVVVGEVGGGERREHLALGATPNIAARLQAIAGANAVVVGATTYRLVRESFDYKALGLQTFKGIFAPMAVYQVLEERTSSVPAEGPGEEPTPLVGREEELGLLLGQWTQAKAGGAPVVLLSGEAGLGKSRLVQQLKALANGRQRVTLECRCSSTYQHSPLHPLIDLLQRVCGFERQDTPETRVQKLEQKLTQLSMPLPDMVPLLASLLSIPLNPSYVIPVMTPPRQRQRTLEALHELLAGMAHSHPVLFVVEDVQWADESTVEWLSMLLDRKPPARTLTVLTSRPDRQSPLSGHPSLTQVILTPLDDHLVEAMIGRVTGGKQLPVEVVRAIVHRTDGVPIFVEELTKTVLESGLLKERNGSFELIGPLSALAIPATLHDSLAARLDRLAETKEVAQLAAALGLEFDFELLQAVSPLTEAELRKALARFLEAGIIRQQGVPPRATYAFRHSLIQEAAYTSMLKSTRRQYHQRIAQVLEDRFPEVAEVHPELLAHHYTLAGLSEPAVLYWQQAGQFAIQRSANLEAAAHLSTALELVKNFPELPERARQELTLQSMLGPALMAARGYAAPEVEVVYQRARDLSTQVGQTARLFPILRGLHRFFLVRAKFQTAYELGEQCLNLAQRIQDHQLMLEAHLALGEALFYLGETALARNHLEQGLTFYDPQTYSAPTLRAIQDPAVACRYHVAYTLWALGYSDQALKRGQEALALAQELAHPFTLAYAFTASARLYQLRREWRITLQYADSALALAAEQGFALFAAAATILRGWALTEQGNISEGIAQLRRGLENWERTGAVLLRPYFLALTAEAFGRSGEARTGLALVEDALSAVEVTNERHFEVELHRLNGDLFLLLEAEAELLPAGEAEACYRRALAVSGTQNARMHGVRAAASLARLLRGQQRLGEAREILAAAYDFFTEGFATPDLTDAGGLLNELSTPPP